MRFQKLVFLIQYWIHRDFYDFKKHHYGPYSHELNLDTTLYPGLISYQIRESSNYRDSYYYSYELTERGARYLSSIEKKIGTELVGKVDDALTQYSKLSTNRLLDLVYTNFAIRKEDSSFLETKIRREVTDAQIVMNQLFQVHMNRQSVFLAGMVESVGRILSSLVTEDTVRRGVVFRLTEEIVHKCEAAAVDIASKETNSEVLRPSFVEIAELEAYLIDYCESRRITNANLRPPLKDLMTGEEAKRLQRVLADMPIPN